MKLQSLLWYQAVLVHTWSGCSSEVSDIIDSSTCSAELQRLHVSQQAQSS